ncbi:hypothetical protein [Fodinibius sp. SL11]|uniref:ATP-binding protein n=1 Tax=Fodinibius sp. SL11 TaxID=3425690 RepID=UPI003F881738
MRLQKLSIRNFKGVRNRTIEPKGKSLSIFADNKVGKTTLFDAYIWLLFDKDSRGNSTGHFSLKTKKDGKVIPKIEHEVEGVFSGPEVPSNSNRITLRKVYKENWRRKRGNKHEKMDGHTTDYYIDDREVSMGDYQDKVSEIIDEQLFRILTDVYYFAEELNKSDRRDILKGLFDDVSIQDIISGNEEILDYPDILDGLTREKREEQLKSRRRKLDKQLDNIPGLINENQRMIEPVDGIEDAKENISNLKDKKERIAAKKNEVKSGGAIAELKVERNELKAKKQDAKTTHEQQIQQNLAGHRQKVSDLQDKVDEAESDWREAKREYETLEDRLNSKQQDIESIKDELETIKDREPKPASDFGPDVCPVCERPMEDGEEHDYEAYLEEFNEKKADDIKGKNIELQEAEDEAETVAAQLEIAKDKASKANGKLSQRKQALKKAQADLKEAKEEQPDFSDTDEYQKIQEKINEIGTKIENHQAEKESQLAQLNNEIQKVQEQINEQQKLLNTAAQNRKAEQRIEELRQQQDQVAEELDEVEHKLYVIEQFIQAESHYITRKVNEKFSIVEWKMFKEYQNGGIEPDCKAMVDGIPFERGLNDGHRIRAGLDIINTLSEHYGISAPVFVDNAESVTSLPDTDLQIIALIVSKPDKELRVEEGLPMHTGESQPAVA